MTQLEVLFCGPAVTVQDLGRSGYQRFGISGSGAMDGDSYKLALALVGAPAGAAVLEFAMMGGSFKVSEKTLVGVTGGECKIGVNGRTIPPWSSFSLEPDDILTIGALTDSSYGYIVFGGGIDTPLYMGSRSTHSRAKLGGHRGRALEPGDRLGVLPIEGRRAPRLVAVPPSRGDQLIRVVLGPQDGSFTSKSLGEFFSEGFVVSVARDRMAMNLTGPTLVHEGGFNIVSDATAFGSIQVPGSGNPIVLLADRQTTGGYPKIATVVSADIPSLVQIVSGRRVHFLAVSVEDAEQAARDAHSKFQRTLNSIYTLADSIFLSSDQLLSNNLISGVVNAAEE